MKNQAEAQKFNLTEFESKELFTTSVTIYDYHKVWIDKRETEGHKINISKLLRAVLDQLIASEKK